MQQCETSTETSVKRVSVRTGGAGHAHSGVITGQVPADGAIAEAVSDDRTAITGNIIVKLGT